MQIESGRATRKEIVAEVQNRMRLLKMNQRMFKHFQAGEIFCSDIWEVYPMQEEYKPLLEKISHDANGRVRLVPYHTIYRESSKNGRLLHILYISTDKDDWAWSRNQIRSLEIPCVTVSLDHDNRQTRDSMLVTSIASAALESSVLPFIECEAEEVTDGLLRWKKIWRFLKRLCPSIIRHSPLSSFVL